ncbi:MAG: hypothetical protein ACYTBJ_06740 [Planctomycetota bacterium]
MKFKITLLRTNPPEKSEAKPDETEIEVSIDNLNLAEVFISGQAAGMVGKTILNAPIGEMKAGESVELSVSVSRME